MLREGPTDYINENVGEPKKTSVLILLIPKQNYVQVYITIKNTIL